MNTQKKGKALKLIQLNLAMVLNYLGQTVWFLALGLHGSGLSGWSL
jgi:hypothetical protein